MDQSSENHAGKKTAATPGKRQAAAATTREGRLRAALKANMARRKAQAKGRASSQDGDAGRSGEGFGESPGDD